MVSDKYDGMFSICPIKRKFQLADKKSVQHKFIDPLNPYDLANESIYDLEGNLVEEADQVSYNSDFIIRLCRIYVLDVEPFLNHHYQHTPNKTRFLDYIEFGMTYSEHIKPGIKAKMASWVKEKRQPTEPEAPSEIEIWFSEYELRQFIDMAKRYPVNIKWGENRPFGIFSHYVETGRDNFEKFSTQLNRKLSHIPPANWKAVELDLEQRFLKGINSYIDWYNEHVERLKECDPYNPYSAMLSVIESTKQEIEKYFPHLAQQANTTNVALPVQVENEKWSSIPVSTIVKHFGVMNKRKSSNGDVFLSDSVFKAFIDKAFRNEKSIPKQRINFSRGEKGFVIKRFYEFFDLAVREYGEVTKKEKYINLVYDCFDNLGTKESIRSFFKPNKTAEKW